VTAPPRTYLEDIAIGHAVRTPALTVTEAHVAFYGNLVGERAGDPTAVPELLPLCLVIGLGWRIPEPPLAVLAFVGFEWHIERVLRVGDTIHSRSRVVTTRSMREGGIVVEEREIRDQHDAVAQRGRFTFLVAKRPQGLQS